jgi:hypothetical protein
MKKGGQEPKRSHPSSLTGKGEKRTPELPNDDPLIIEALIDWHWNGHRPTNRRSLARWRASTQLRFLPPAGESEINIRRDGNLFAYDRMLKHDAVGITYGATQAVYAA